MLTQHKIIGFVELDLHCHCNYINEEAAGRMLGYDHIRPHQFQAFVKDYDIMMDVFGIIIAYWLWQELLLCQPSLTSFLENLAPNSVR